MPSTPIQSPASYVPSRAAAYADIDGTALLVSASNPMPVSVGPAAAAAALAGSTATSAVLGPFVPAAGRPVVLALSGTWVGTVAIKRSTDGGTTKLPLTVGGNAWGQFTANVCEPVWEENEAGAALYLDVTLSSGTLAYRLAQ
jgi:hypothetical protein